MLTLRLIPTLGFILAGSFAVAAKTAAPPPALANPAPAAIVAKASSSQRRAASLLKELKLADAGQEARLRAILESHFTARMIA